MEWWSCIELWLKSRIVEAVGLEERRVGKERWDDVKRDERDERRCEMSSLLWLLLWNLTIPSDGMVGAEQTQPQPVGHDVPV